MKEKELVHYVENLFSNYNQTKEIQEMKEEILSNLEAKVDDYISQGMSYDKAFEQAIKYIDTVDFMIDGNMKIYVNRYLTELVQTSLIYSLLIWILTIPTRVMFEGRLLNGVLMIISIAVGVIYLSLVFRMNDNVRNTVSIVNTTYIFRWRRRVWLIWVVFIIAILFSVTALKFGSNLWFWRPVRISGPYQFAQLLYLYTSPVISIVVPLLFNKAFKIVGKYEVNG